MATRGILVPRIDIRSLPDLSKAEVDFHDTSFFLCDPKTCRQLPTPSSLLEQWPALGSGVIKIEALHLAVKFGNSSDVRPEEAQVMRAIRQAFPDKDVPVPEVFGWRKLGDLNFIYMSLVPGQTLRQAWTSLTQADKNSICSELKRIVAALRRITPDRSIRFIGSINGGTVQDRFFKPDYENGPFLSIKDFNDLLLAAATRQAPGQDVIPDPYRDFFPDSGGIYFTHGDLTLGNIIVSGEPGSKRIVGIIDWEQSGWYPQYWEYCKLLYGVEYTHEWREDGWAEDIMEPFEDEWAAFAEYSLWRCP
ncbi:hypothetical protein HIM_05594 [Hirsutella minnesotensis 3608]|uniref:Aminoglycoside phosphotransferase domain-containing protein n=1 Tax=Hirsutella minnesotensis 3608 TaxID=1043627 RepID=A0A0F7ZUM2_9HYPO|nr:hypothetical protein HIM_05594 [Hirsutella minnesotensis 3608]